jgi:hypothetical protein
VVCDPGNDDAGEPGHRGCVSMARQ